ncbi:MgtC/SapB family protein [Halobacillus litoralis]|uniref:MgtC/SapB family protein n=1 Tax=Halobacillus litoralis TaxID=45668 RepID=A0A845DW81_9BACI|nr:MULTISPECIES: MgtC/SapB family protein [Halobacillus]MCA1024387.1 MgtC/SapB family protein [Halobacillus litoralis]MYL21943.1 MgtC/SapB family protein [Halobacillus litoralis]MYL31909.1 MgtC/SapB family protein [Halobacillus halophilus]MYL39743.1 MgtC/SapB family protein [Halobacillus litoralis]
MSWSYFFHEDILMFIFRLFFALLLAGLIGFERELKNHSAGFRTHILVGVGACMMMLLSLYGFQTFMEEYDNVRFDPARIPSYVISGIGFLGAGTIIVNGITIRGLTTAASIWTVAGIGLVVGAGMYDVATVTTFFVLISLILLNKVEKEKLNGGPTFHITIKKDLQIHQLLSLFDQESLDIRSMDVKSLDGEQKRVIIQLEKQPGLNRSRLLAEITSIKGVEGCGHDYP